MVFPRRGRLTLCVLLLVLFAGGVDAASKSRSRTKSRSLTMTPFYTTSDSKSPTPSVTPTPSATSSLSTDASTSSSLSSSVTPTPSVTATLSAVAAKAASSSSLSPSQITGISVGAAVGGLLLVTVIVFVVLAKRPRPKRRHSSAFRRLDSDRHRQFVDLAPIHPVRINAVAEPLRTMAPADPSEDLLAPRRRQRRHRPRHSRRERNPSVTSMDDDDDASLVSDAVPRRRSRKSARRSHSESRRRRHDLLPVGEGDDGSVLLASSRTVAEVQQELDERERRKDKIRQVLALARKKRSTVRNNLLNAAEDTTAAPLPRPSSTQKLAAMANTYDQSQPMVSIPLQAAQQLMAAPAAYGYPQALAPPHQQYPALSPPFDPMGTYVGPTMSSGYTLPGSQLRRVKTRKLALR